MIKEAGINFGELGDDAEFDNPMGVSSGAGVIFGATGGVIEATIRTTYEWIKYMRPCAVGKILL